MTALATARAAVVTSLSGITTAQVYRRRQTNYQYPCLVVGWPDEFDPRPVQGGGTLDDFVLPVWVACEITDDDSSDDLLSTLLDSTVTALGSTAAWGVEPISNFGEQQSEDGRTIVWCSIPLKVMS
jgi:hypothetical protein